eukprot:snap_masked-scaffold_14-processed-gene-4.42-mRNA-1 protein AED:1.00 eAED:1.00 QI:0/0/0/0/1/1/4/0/375
MKELKIVVGCYDGSLHGWNLNIDEYLKDLSSNADLENLFENIQLKFQYKAHESCIKCIKIRSLPISSGKKKLMASSSTDQTFKVYDLEQNEEIGEHTVHEDSVNVVDFIGEKYVLSGDGKGKLLLWRTSNWNNVHEFKGHKAGAISGLHVHPSQKFFFTTSNDNSIRMWEAASGKAASRNKVVGFKVIDLLSWSPAGTGYVAVADRSNLLHFDIKDPKGEFDFTKRFSQAIYSICYVSDTVVAIGLESGLIQIIGTNFEDSLCEIQLPQTDEGKKHNSRCRYLKFITDIDVLIAVCTDGVVRFFTNILTGNNVQQIGIELDVASSSHVTAFDAALFSNLENEKVLKRKQVEVSSGESKIKEQRSISKKRKDTEES